MPDHILTNDRFDRYTQRKEWATDNKHICYLPYNSLQFFHSSKYISPCCNLIPTVETDYIQPIIRIKQAITEKKPFLNCSICYNCEADGKISERTRYLIELTDNQLDNFLREQEVAAFNIHCTFSNLCNMACRSCNVDTSSLFAKIETGKEMKTSTISDDSNYWNTLLNSIKTEVNQRELVNLVISGGEGFVQPDFKKLLDWLIVNDIASKINLTVNTNGIVDNEKFIKFLCDNFKQVSLAVSVDSIYENYHYVRWPGTWERIEDNLNTFSYYRNNTKNFNFFLTPVWSINNIFYVADWILYFENFKQKYNFPYFFAYDTPLYQPSWLDIKYMPDYVKKRAAQSLETVLDNKWLHTNKSLNTNINNLYSILLNGKNNTHEETWRSYLEKTAEWDVKTNASAETYNCKLFDSLNDNDKALFYNYKNNVRPTEHQMKFHRQSVTQH